MHISFILFPTTKFFRDFLFSDELWKFKRGGFGDQINHFIDFNFFDTI